MKEKVYNILNQNGQLILSLSWRSDKSKEDIYPKMEKYIYENIIFILLLIKEVYEINYESKKIDIMSFIQENIDYLDGNVVFEIGKTFLLDKTTIGKIRDEIKKREEGIDIDWNRMKNDAILALSNMNISKNLNSEIFESENLNDDFLR